MRKLLSILTALSLFIPTIAVIADDPSATTEPEKEIRVVGKRITGDDTYFEISLELDRDYEEYSAVGVVLEYDPTVIWPAESWDDGAGKADMDGIDSWSTRRALPTLGKDTWTTHTALTYIRPKDETDPDNIIPAKGYLYLGAEYPGTTPNTVDPSATTDPAATPAATPETTPAASPAEETETDPYSNPIVVARFMYVGDDPAATKAALVSAWETGANVTPTAETWDKHWQQNEILTLAGDDIAEKSPGEYAGAVYFADYSKKVYMHTFPSPAPTAAPESTLAPGATPTPLPTFAPYTPPAVGSGLTADEKLTADKIEIVTGEGSSAKVTGGMKLSDVFAILFFDWDNSFIGAVTAAKGQDMTEAVNNYVRDQLVYPDLRTPTPAQISSLARTDNYRGEYPHTGPNATNPTKPGGTGSVTDGDKYPITNKLDYVFAGKDFYEGYPFAGGWTKVDATNMEDTWTILSKNKLVGYSTADEFYPMPTPDPDSGLPSATTPPTLESFDFSTITNEMIEDAGGTLFFKAVYKPGADLDKNDDNRYTYDDGTLKYLAMTNTTTATANVVFIATFDLLRLNASGYGLSLKRDPKVRMVNTIGGNSTTLTVDVNNGDRMNVQFITSSKVSQITYKLMDTYGATVETGADMSNNNPAGIIYADKTASKDYTGFIAEGTLRRLLNQELANINGGSAANITMYTLKNIGLKATATGTAFNAGTVNTKKANFKTFVQKALADTTLKAKYTTQQEIVDSLTYYQLQWFIIKGNNAFIADPATAEANCKGSGGFSWCKP